MQPEKIYQELCDLAEKLGVSVSEQSFRGSGFAVKSSFCRIKGAMHCIIDKHIALKEKIAVLAQALYDLPHENLFVVPAVRDVILKFGKQQGETGTGQTDT